MKKNIYNRVFNNKEICVYHHRDSPYINHKEYMSQNEIANRWAINNGYANLEFCNTYKLGIVFCKVGSIDHTRVVPKWYETEHVLRFESKESMLAWIEENNDKKTVYKQTLYTLINSQFIWSVACY